MMNNKSVLISIILLVLLSFSLSETIKNKEQKEEEEEKGNATSSAKMKINTMTTFRSSMIMNSNLEIDSPSAPAPSGGDWNIGDSLALEKQRINKKETEQAPAPISTKSTDEKKEVKTKTKGLTLKEDIIYSVLSSSVKSSLKNSNYIKEKRYKEYAKKIGVDVIANLATRLVFKAIKGPMENVIQFGVFLGTTLLNCKGKTVNDSIIHCLKQFIKLFLLIVAGIISGKMSKNIAIKAILYGILAYLAETGVSIIFTILLKK